MTGQLEEKLQYTFKNKILLLTALTHSSAANETREPGIHSNERLEFLGDSVLGMITAEYLYRRYPHLSEGELTRLRASMVCESSLYEVATALELGRFILLGKGEEQSGGRTRVSILADATEAVLGAVFLDGGIAAIRRVASLLILRKSEAAQEGRMFRDYKTMLQEIVQRNKQEQLSYRLTDEIGPDHDKRFVVTVYINSNAMAKGEGKSKKEAEQQAAKEALGFLGML